MVYKLPANKVFDYPRIRSMYVYTKGDPPTNGQIRHLNFRIPPRILYVERVT